MKYVRILFFLFASFQSLQANSYVQSLDTQINQTIQSLKGASYKLDTILPALKKNIKKNFSLDQIDIFLSQDFIDDIENIACESYDDLQDQLRHLQFLLAAKLYYNYLCCCEDAMLEKALKNYNTINFWQDEKFKAEHSWYQKNIARGFMSIEYEQKIDEYSKIAKDCSDLTDYFLGILFCNKIMLSKAQNKEEFERHLKSGISLQSQFLNMDYHNNQNLLITVKNLVAQCSSFDIYFDHQHALCKVPSHFEQHKLTYLSVLVGTAIVAGMYAAYQQEIVQGANYIHNEYIKKSINIFTNGFNQILQQSQFDITENQEKLDALNRAALQAPAPYGGDIPDRDTLFKNLDRISHGAFSKRYQDIKNILKRFSNFIEWDKKIDFSSWYAWSKSVPKEKNSSEQITIDEEDSFLLRSYNQELDWYQERKKYIATLSDQEKLALINQEDIQRIEYPEKNFIDVPSALLRQGQREIMGVKQQANIVLQILYSVLGVNGVIYATTLATHGNVAYNSVAYKSIRLLVRNINTFLNELLSAPFSFHHQGHLFFLTKQLEKQIQLLPYEERKLMKKDIEHLRSDTLTYVQKFNIAQQMYQTYSWLVP